MGTQKRYAEGNARRRFNLEAEGRALMPRSLSEAERGVDSVTRGTAVPVKAWLDFGNTSVQVMATATAWTKRCVLVVWTDSHEQMHEVWTWAGAVERIEP